MPITTSAKKALRGSARKRVFNIRRKSALLDAVKDIKKIVASKSKDEALKLLPSVYQAIDKAAKRGIIKENTAARKKSRISAMIKKIA
ncbi:MAG: 30S ribosomal protein S20 [Candidatus Paceibacterota bacterium]|jgi:small subunit ribosomal protein S20